METPESLIGQRLGEYNIIAQIDAGGIAPIFKAYQTSVKREVALKLLPPYLTEQADFTAAFIQAAQGLTELRHDHILPVYDFGQDRGYSYIAMRYLPQATTLADLRPPLSPGQISHWIGQLAGALDHAHQAGLIHGDVKPSNVLIAGDQAYLSDFSLAKIVAETTTLSGAGGMGTPAYMAPEQGLGQAVDRRTDIYALGIMAFEMLTGQIPHQAETPLATVMKRANEPLPALRSLNPALPESLEPVLAQALAPRPEDRFESAGQLAASLQAAFNQAPSVPVMTASPGEAPPGDTSLRADPTPAPQAAPSTAAVARSGRHTLDIVVLTLLGIVGLCGLMTALLGFIDEGGAVDLSFVLMGGSQVMVSLSSMALVWFRERRVPASAWLVMGILSWFIGTSLLSVGLGLVPGPIGEQSFPQNLGELSLVCFTPGGFLALLGLGFYFYDRKIRGAEVITRSPGQATTAKAQPNSRQKQQADKLKRAADYLSRISHLVKQHKGPFFTHQATSLTKTLTEWESRLKRLVERLDAFEANAIIQRDLREVPRAIERLQAALQAEQDPQLRAQMNGTLGSYEKHQQQLKVLTTLMRRTELEIDETLATIGTIYSQLQVVGAKDIDSERAKRLSGEVKEEADRLGDLLAAMDEVYQETTQV